MRKFLIFNCLFLFLVCYSVMGQPMLTESENSNRSLDQARRLFATKNYAGCIDLIKNSTDKMWFAADREEADYLVLFSSFELRHFNTPFLLEAFDKQYPLSAYRYGCDYVAANVAFDRKEWTKALQLYVGIPSSQISQHWEKDYAYRLALSYLFADHYEEAKQIILSLPANDPFYAQAVRYYSAYIDYREKRYDRAVETFLSLEKEKDFETVVPLFITQIYYLQGRSQKAIDYGTAYLKSEPDAQQALEITRIVGECYFNLKNYAQAIQLLETYFSGAPQPLASAYFAYGSSLYSIQSYTNAIVPLTKAIVDENAQTQTAQFLLGMCYVRTNDMRNAQLAFDAASKMTFDKQVQEQALYNHALSVHHSGTAGFDGAVVLFERFLNLFPHSTLRESMSEYLVEVYSTTKNYKAALTSIEKIKNLTPTLLAAKQRIFYRMGVESVVNGGYQEGVAHFSKAIQMGNMGNLILPESYFWRGESHYRRGNYREAANDYSAFVRHTPEKRGNHYAMGFYNLGYAYFKMGNMAQARTAFEQFAANLVRKTDPVYGDALNRLGDCFYSRRSFLEAENYYYLSAKTMQPTADYAFYQQAFMQGLQKKNSEKQRTLDRLLSSFPQSPLVDDALFEKGRTYLNDDRNLEAVSVFERLIKEIPQSPFVKKAMLQIAFAYRNDDKLAQASEAYKSLIKQYPGSEETLIANTDLKTISRDLNQVEDYAVFIESLGGAVKFSASEQDSLTFDAAERKYEKGELAVAKNSFVKYLQAFPHGVFINSSNYYLANIELRSNQMQGAYQYYLNILNQPENRYTEEATAFVAQQLYTSKSYDEAYMRYAQLLGRSTSQNNRLAAKEGMLRSSWALGQMEDVLITAEKLLQEAPLLAPEIINEVKLMQVKALTALNQKEKSEPVLVDLATDTRDKSGAEAAFLLARLYVDQGRTDKAEKLILTFIDNGTPHLYWLARTFILYSDILVGQNKTFEARQYLLSLQSNYKVKDDIQMMIEERLSKLN